MPRILCVDLAVCPSVPASWLQARCYVLLVDNKPLDCRRILQRALYCLSAVHKVCFVINTLFLFVKNSRAASVSKGCGFRHGQKDAKAKIRQAFDAKIFFYCEVSVLWQDVAYFVCHPVFKRWQGVNACGHGGKGNKARFMPFVRCACQFAKLKFGAHGIAFIARP